MSLLATSTSQANCTCAAESAPAVAVSNAANVEGSWRRQKREVQRITETSLLLFYRWRPQILRQKMLSQVRWTSQPKSSLLLLQGRPRTLLCAPSFLTPALLLLLSLQHHHHWPDPQGSFISKKLLTFLPWVCFLPDKDTEEQRKKPEAQINSGADRKLVQNCTARKGWWGTIRRKRDDPFEQQQAVELFDWPSHFLTTLKAH